jgi:hypothetical protein
MKYYLAIKRNGVLIHVTTWMNLENMILNERIQKQKATILHDSTYKMSKIGKSIDRNYNSSFQELREVTANTPGASFQEERNVLKLDSRDDCTT